MRKGEEADRRIIDAALKAANESAKDAAPFLHPRLSAIEHSGSPPRKQTWSVAKSL
jgi:hypothetical protein